jgi:nucleotide-binding universal stress UspA family protein
MQGALRREKPMKKILVAYDGTEGADRALTTAIDLAKAFQAKVGVVSVIPVHPGRIGIDPWDDRPVHEEQLRRARTTLVQAGIEPTLIEPAGPPAVAIEEEAESRGYDTIVVGSRGLNSLSRAFQGSVSEHVATHAKETVIIAR